MYAESYSAADIRWIRANMSPGAIAMARDRLDELTAARTTAWDCDPCFSPDCEGVYDDLDEEDAEGEWQLIALDRFGDRLVNGRW